MYKMCEIYVRNDKEFLKKKTAANQRFAITTQKFWLIKQKS